MVKDYKDQKLEVDTILQSLAELRKSFKLEVDLRFLLPDDPVKGRKNITKWFISCYKKAQESTTIDFLQQLTQLHIANVLIVDQAALKLCQTLSENFHVFDLDLHVLSLEHLPKSFIGFTQEQLQRKQDGMPTPSKTDMPTPSKTGMPTPSKTIQQPRDTPATVGSETPVQSHLEPSKSTPKSNQRAHYTFDFVDDLKQSGETWIEPEDLPSQSENTANSQENTRH